eukprot:1738520-Prymnesium_polylepis.1
MHQPAGAGSGGVHGRPRKVRPAGGFSLPRVVISRGAVGEQRVDCRSGLLEDARRVVEEERAPGRRPEGSGRLAAACRLAVHEGHLARDQRSCGVRRSHRWGAASGASLLSHRRRRMMSTEPRRARAATATLWASPPTHRDVLATPRA